jgi:hypothetical protein
MGTFRLRCELSHSLRFDLATGGLYHTLWERRCFSYLVNKLSWWGTGVCTLALSERRLHIDIRRA